MLNLPNLLTYSRVLAVPVIVVMLYYPGRLVCLLAMLLFIAAALTDMVDGILARRMNIISNFGKFLDPLADKLLISSVLVMLVQLGWVSAWIAIVIIARELTVTGLRAMASDKGLVMAADRYGKMKTIFQIVALCPLILHYPWFGLDPVLPGMVLLYVSLGLTIFSGANYLYNFYKMSIVEG
jgi:CDP-diacylglycerol--glycerol-3-phosphate 3-phosphatidyltransferase